MASKSTDYGRAPTTVFETEHVKVMVTKTHHNLYRVSGVTCGATVWSECVQERGLVRAVAAATVVAKNAEFIGGHRG